MQMQTSHAASIHNGALAKAVIPSFNGHPDYDMMNALAKVSPQAQTKAKATSQDFEAMFLNSMFSQMTSGLQGEGPYGSTTGTGVWRSMLTEQYSKSFRASRRRRHCQGRLPHAHSAASQPHRPDPDRPDPGQTGMTPHPQRQPAPIQIPMASTPAEARKLAENMMEVMSALLGLVERETELVRAGKIREAMAFEPKKTELSRRYANIVACLKASQKYMTQAAPELLTTLHRHHDTFRAMLQINLTVLATAHAVSESVIRGVNTEIQRRNIPNTYTAAGRRATPGPRHMTPLAVSRSL